MMSELGFIGLGTMGVPIALNILKSGRRLCVWNRSSPRTEVLEQAGAVVETDVRAVFESCATVFLMLSDENAISAVLSLGDDSFSSLVRSRTVVNLGTVSAPFSQHLDSCIRAAGGRYVEAPVSGSRVPAEQGKLVAMLAGAAEDVEEVFPLFSAFCTRAIRSGSVPKALQMKFAVNLYLIGMVTSLAESFHMAQKQELNLDVFLDVLLAGPMANDILRVKGPKLLARDWEAQATISTVTATNQLIVDAARQVGAHTPIVDLCLTLNERTTAAGRANLDMASVITVFEDLASTSFLNHHR